MGEQSSLRWLSSHASPSAAAAPARNSCPRLRGQERLGSAGLLRGLRRACSGGMDWPSGVSVSSMRASSRCSASCAAQPAPEDLRRGSAWRHARGCLPAPSLCCAGARPNAFCAALPLWGGADGDDPLLLAGDHVLDLDARPRVVANAANHVAALRATGREWAGWRALHWRAPTWLTPAPHGAIGPPGPARPRQIDATSRPRGPLGQAHLADDGPSAIDAAQQPNGHDHAAAGGAAGPRASSLRASAGVRAASASPRRGRVDRLSQQHARRAKADARHSRRRRHTGASCRCISRAPRANA